MRRLKSLLVIGGGNMGRSLIEGVLLQKLVDESNVTVVEPNPERAAVLRDELGLTVVASAAEVNVVPQALLVAVKPQIAEKVCPEYQSLVRSDTLVLSCMAGKTLKSLQSLFPSSRRFVRFMPNLPAQIGESMSVFIHTPEVSEEGLQFVEAFLQCSGEYLRVDQEELIDAATAVAGSGTGYVAYFLEHMVHCAESLGFSYEEASLLVGQTMKGAVALWTAKEKRPEELKDAVTSPGGTTAAALAVFDQRGVGSGIQAGMKAAFNRSKEL